MVVVYDETLVYKEMRAVTAPEVRSNLQKLQAIMRLLEMPIYMVSHIIVPLSVHEEDQQTIYFTSDTMQAKRRRLELGIEDSKFTGWFAKFHLTCKG